MKFIHLSDLHVTNDPSALENQMLTQLRESIIWRYDDEEKPAILISGDLVDNGAGDEFDQVVSILTPLKHNGFELIICPGNHDYGKNGIHYRDASSDLFFEKIERGLLGYDRGATNMESLYPKVTALENSKVVFFGLDSTEGKMDNLWNLHLLANGKIGKEQRTQLRDRLIQDQYKEYTKVVYLHNHPWELVPGHGLDDGIQFLKEIEGLVDIMCFGHIHISKFWESRDSMLAMNAGKSTDPISYRGKNCLSYREISLNGPEISSTVIRVPLDQILVE